MCPFLFPPSYGWMTTISPFFGTYPASSTGLKPCFSKPGPKSLADLVPLGRSIPEALSASLTKAPHLFCVLGLAFLSRASANLSTFRELFRGVFPGTASALTAPLSARRSSEDGSPARPPGTLRPHRPACAARSPRHARSCRGAPDHCPAPAPCRRGRRRRSRGSGGRRGAPRRAGSPGRRSHDRWRRVRCRDRRARSPATCARYRSPVGLGSLYRGCSAKDRNNRSTLSPAGAMGKSTFKGDVAADDDDLRTLLRMAVLPMSVG